jgi:hypothetical protein
MNKRLTEDERQEALRFVSAVLVWECVWVHPDTAARIEGDPAWLGFIKERGNVRVCTHELIPPGVMEALRRDYLAILGTQPLWPHGAT